MIIRTLLLFVLSSVSLFSFSESFKLDSVANKIDDKGRKQGLWKVTYENGKTKYEATFKDNKPVGEMKRFYDDGTIKAIMVFDASGKKAKAKLFYNNGVLAGEGNFVDSNKDSIWKYYSFYDKTLKMEESYVNGVKDGPTKKYYSDGKLAEVIGYKNGLKNGIWKQYFNNDSLELEATFVNDKRSGVFTAYYPNGKVEMKGAFKDNYRDGNWTYFDENGTGVMTVNYIKDVPQNTSALDKRQEEFFKILDSNKGKIPEPDENNIMEK
jgi:antitoxin component YwqK of YwqJK toxin-antitoxin module